MYSTILEKLLNNLNCVNIFLRNHICLSAAADRRTFDADSYERVGYKLALLIRNVDTTKRERERERVYVSTSILTLRLQFSRVNALVTLGQCPAFKLARFWRPVGAPPQLWCCHRCTLIRSCSNCSRCCCAPIVPVYKCPWMKICLTVFIAGQEWADGLNVFSLPWRRLSVLGNAWFMRRLHWRSKINWIGKVLT